MIHIGMSSPRWDRVLQWVVGGLIAISGVISQIPDTVDGAHTQTHLMFGMLLSVGVLCRFRYGLWTHRARLREIEAFSRQLTRIVYVLLYALLAVKVTLNLAAAGGMVTPPAMFQPYLACGVAAVVLIRVLALYSFHRGPLTWTPANAAAATLGGRPVEHVIDQPN